MGAFPFSSMAGHRKLHDLVCAALDRCIETQSVEFKQSATWDDLKWGLIKTLMAMGNLRDGGFVIVGVSETGGQWSPTGIEEPHLSTFEADTIRDALAKYCSPAPEVSIVLVKHGAPEPFLVIQAHEFDSIPFVCQRDNSQAAHAFFAGDFFVRPPGKPQTKKVTTALEMHDLLELSAEKQARRMLEAYHRIGVASVPTPVEAFDAELGGL